ncbi:MAG: ArsR/SmtB family transcription factor [Thermoanaerobaculia bacterium]
MNEPRPRPELERTPGAVFFKALAHSGRLELLAELAACCGGARTVSELAAAKPRDLSVISRHLAVLRDAGLVSAERAGREVRYCCCYDELLAALKGLTEAIESCCPPGSGAVCCEARPDEPSPSDPADRSPDPPTSERRSRS